MVEKLKAIGEALTVVLFLGFVVAMTAFGFYYEFKKMQFFLGFGQ